MHTTTIEEALSIMADPITPQKTEHTRIFFLEILATKKMEAMKEVTLPYPRILFITPTW